MSSEIQLSGKVRKHRIQPVDEALQRSNQKHRGHSRALYLRPNMLSSMWSLVKIHQT